MKCKIKQSWLKMESEHTKNKIEQIRIVNQHINKYGCSYYPALIKMEKKLSKKK